MKSLTSIKEKGLLLSKTKWAKLGKISEAKIYTTSEKDLAIGYARTKSKGSSYAIITLSKNVLTNIPHDSDAYPFFYAFHEDVPAKYITSVEIYSPDDKLIKTIRAQGELYAVAEIIDGDYVLLPMSKTEDTTFFKENRGGPGSGNEGHAGRPGEVGGSTSTTTTYQEIKDKPAVLKDPKTAKQWLPRIVGEWVAHDGRAPAETKMMNQILPQTVSGGSLSQYHPGNVTLYRGGEGKGSRSWTTNLQVAKGYGKVTSVKITTSDPAFSLNKFLGEGQSEFEVIYNG